MQNETSRCGYVAIVGAPNAGKSTLLNRVMGTKLAIVTPKAQTTRNPILGITTQDDTQVIFVDTPGIYQAEERFERAMVSSALNGARDADLILLMVDASRGITPTLENVIERLKALPAIKYLVLNKVDVTEKETLLQLTQQLYEKMEFESCFMISARKGDGVKDLLRAVSQRMPGGPWLFPEDQMTDLSERFLAAEITREKLFFLLQKELPYQVAVETEQWEERKDGSVKISQVIFVRTESHKKIVLGSGGEMLKTIGQRAREELQKLMERKVHLFLFVKVAERWKEDAAFYQSIGLEYKK